MSPAPSDVIVCSLSKEEGEAIVDGYVEALQDDADDHHLGN